MNAFSGVGGSAGGDKRANNPAFLDYYLGYSAFIYDIPSVEFKVPDSETVYLPIYKTCIRNNDQLESKEEVLVTKIDDKNKPIAHVQEVVRRERKYLKRLSIFSIANTEDHLKEVEIPRDYTIRILTTGSHGNRFLRNIDYSINDCE